MEELIEVKSFGSIKPKVGSNSRVPYEHQKKAMQCLDIINKEESYSTLVVLPTGGGKTYTASMWLLKNAIDKNKKVLWLAHRQMLLEQAAESFQKFAYAEVLPHVSSFNYRIISGATNHDRTIDIKKNDNLLIVSKDSIGRNPSCLDEWLKSEKEIYLIIDEAHHSTAKTYRKVIEYIQSRVANVKLIGLTATPFRTAQEEQGLLAKVYKDGLDTKGKSIQENMGITYQIGLKDLINRRILSKPIFENYYTNEDYGASLGLDAWENIQHLDVIPDDIAGMMATSAGRNKLIVETYNNKQDDYGQTIVFAVNIIHAIHLSALFNASGVKADYIVSDVRDLITGVRISREDNERKIQDYKDGKLQVLVNVNILTEGIDLPETRTVFLARPTVSSILLTQMIGRALRGEAAGGTTDAYIVSFIDKWNDKIAWANPESLFQGNNEFSDSEYDRARRDVRLIAISKIEEFAKMLDETIDTSSLEKVPFIKRVPIGMYAFSYLEENGIDLSYQVMVYDSTVNAYKDLMESLPVLFKENKVDTEYIQEELLSCMQEQCREAFFCGEMIPPYEERDINAILQYYAQYEEAPQFYTFDEVDRSKIDIATLAQYIWDQDMGPRAKADYVDQVWENEDDNMLRLFFGQKLYLYKQLDVELMKMANPYIYEEEDNVQYGTRKFEELSLYEIGKINPKLEKELRDGAFEASRNGKGFYQCSCCGFEDRSKVMFQVDHIVPMNKGGKSVPTNLQILCRACNGLKGDKL